MVKRDSQEAIAWGEKARSLAEELGDVKLLATNLIGLGSALMLQGDPQGCAYLERSVALAQCGGHDEVAALGMTNLVASAGETFQFPLADKWLRESLDYCQEREFEYYHARLMAWSAITHFYQGRWGQAVRTTEQILELPAGNTARLEALVVKARVNARRGTPAEAGVLAEAESLARQTGTLQDLAPVHIARAEAALQQGDRETAAEQALAALGLAVERKHAWFAGELAVLARQAGKKPEVYSWMAKPFRAFLSGDWMAAARAWQRHGCPFEQAWALAEGEPVNQFNALTIFEELGAFPAAQAVRRRLRSAGIRNIPRGPHRNTRANPFGLTPRQMEVLRLIADGLSNRQIAARLMISQRTAEHHVAAVLNQLNAASRMEAVRALQKEDGEKIFPPS